MPILLASQPSSKDAKGFVPAQAMAHNAAMLEAVAMLGEVFFWWPRRAVWAAAPVKSPAAPAAVAAIRLASGEIPQANRTTVRPRTSSEIVA